MASRPWLPLDLLSTARPGLTPTKRGGQRWGRGPPPAPSPQGPAGRLRAASPACGGAFTGHQWRRQGNRGSGLPLRCSQWGLGPSAVTGKASVLITRVHPLLSPWHPSSSRVQLLSTWGQARRLALAASPNPGSRQTPTHVLWASGVRGGLLGSGVGRIGVQPVLGTGGQRDIEGPQLCPRPPGRVGVEGPLCSNCLARASPNRRPGKPPRRGGGRSLFPEQAWRSRGFGQLPRGHPQARQLRPVLPGALMLLPTPTHLPLSASSARGLPVVQEGGGPR